MKKLRFISIIVLIVTLLIGCSANKSKPAKTESELAYDRLSKFIKLNGKYDDNNYYLTHNFNEYDASCEIELILYDDGDIQFKIEIGDSVIVRLTHNKNTCDYTVAVDNSDHPMESIHGVLNIKDWTIEDTDSPYDKDKLLYYAGYSLEIIEATLEGANLTLNDFGFAFEAVDSEN